MAVWSGPAHPCEHWIVNLFIYTLLAQFPVCNTAFSIAGKVRTLFLSENTTSYCHVSIGIQVTIGEEGTTQQLPSLMLQTATWLLGSFNNPGLCFPAA